MERVGVGATTALCPPDMKRSIPTALTVCRSPTNNRGWIPLVVAENKLGNQLVLDRMSQVTSFPAWVMNYGGMKGSPALQAALADLLQRTFVPEPTLDPESMCILAGCSGILDHLFFCLADAAESILIPAPYYPAFDNDLQATSSLIPLAFFLNEDEDITAQLDQAAAAAKHAGQPVRALLITNPNNPLGIIYKQETVQAMLCWCLENKIHYVSDEIYALSVYKSSNGNPKTNAFVSALTVANGLVESGLFDQADMDMFVHLVYGMSKDWCASGLRVGLLYSRNAKLQQVGDHEFVVVYILISLI